MNEEKITKFHVYGALKFGKALTEKEFEFCKRNIHLFENLRFMKLRPASPKWRFKGV